MRDLLTLIALCMHWAGSAQSINELNGKWCFTGFRTTIFSVRNEKLYVGLLESRDTLNFKGFLENSILDTAILVEATVSTFKDTLKIEADFPKIKHRLNLEYNSSSVDVIIFMGDVYFDSASLIRTNRNCQLQQPMCINKLYSADDIRRILKMKPVQEFTRDHAFEFLLRLSLQLRDKCNRCYSGFTDAYMNEVFIDMGFNPITAYKFGNVTMYNTSGFTFFMEKKFEKDQTVARLVRLVLGQYSHSTVIN